MKKKILIIGNGANAYALAKEFSKEHEIFVTPASDTLKEFATAVDIREDSVMELLEFVMENGIDMTIAISQKAINADIASIFAKNKQYIFAPSANSANIVNDKAYAKKVLYKLHIPTPKFGIFEKQNVAVDYIKNQTIPYVIKTNDLNSAVIITSNNVAKNILDSLYIEKNKKVIIEDYVYGTSFSFYAITDGYKALPFGSSLTYMHSLEGEGGQLTGGLGSVSPNYKLSIEQEYFLMDNVIYPILEYLENNKSPYLGIIGINGILTDEGEIKVLGCNSFMQDCDAVSILNTLNENLYELFESCIIGSFSDEVDTIKFNNQSSVSLVLACKNKNANENVISGLNNLDENTILTYYPTVTKNRYLEYEAHAGLNIIITTISSSPAKASEIAYSEADDVTFEGKFIRKDLCNNKY